MSPLGNHRCYKCLCWCGLLAAYQVIPVAEAARWQATEPEAGILRLRINNQAGFDSKVLAQAEEIVSKILKHAGVETIVLHCANFAVIDAACIGAPFQPADLLINLMPTAPVLAWGIKPDSIGLVPTATPGSGCFIVYIFRPNIEKLTKDGKVAVADHGLVLGHAIAHEIGHLLLNAPEHSVDGVMMTDWGRKAFDMARTGSLLFLRSQCKKIRAEVQARNAAMKH